MQRTHIIEHLRSSLYRIPFPASFPICWTTASKAFMDSATKGRVNFFAPFLLTSATFRRTIFCSNCHGLKRQPFPILPSPYLLVSPAFLKGENSAREDTKDLSDSDNFTISSSDVETKPYHYTNISLKNVWTTCLLVNVSCATALSSINVVFFIVTFSQSYSSSSLQPEQLSAT